MVELVNCGFDESRFTNCDFDKPSKIAGDGKWNHGRHNNNAECGFDYDDDDDDDDGDGDGDCTEWNVKYPNCWIGDELLFGNGSFNAMW